MLALPLGAKVFATQEQGVAEAFPAADRIDERTFVLDEAEKEAVEKAARAPLDSRIHKFYVARRGDETLGYAYIDVHTVRTLPEALLVAVGADGRVRSVRVLAFHEPLDYLPVARWFRQFEGKRPGDRLRLDRDIDGTSGATLTSRAAVDAVRRVLALYSLLLAKEG